MCRIPWALYSIMWFIIWIILMNNAHSFEVTCYSQKTRIYHGWGHHLVSTDEYIMFVEDATQNVVMASADCIVLEPLTFDNRKRLLSQR